MPIFESSLSRANCKELENNLKGYKYCGPELSLFERLFLKQFWQWFLDNIVPLWLAPNAITFSGFLLHLFGVACVFWSDPTLEGKGESGSNALIVYAVLFFVYQTLDGCDGMQARRTKSGSPLGEVFDHGCDALVTGLSSVITMAVCKFPIFSPLGMLFISLPQTAFMCSNLTLLHVGKQLFNEIDCQECIIAIQCICIIRGLGYDWIFDGIIVPLPSLLSETLPSVYITDGGMTLGKCIVFFGSLGPLLNNLKAIVYILKGMGHSKEKNCEGRGLTALTHQLVLLAVYCVMHFYAGLCIYRMPQLDGSLVLPYVILQCVTFGDIMNHTLVTRVTKLPFPTLFRSRALWFMFIFMLVCAAPHHTSIDGDVLYALRWSLAIGSILSNLQYCLMMGTAFCNALNIRAFTIPYQKKLD